MNGHDVGCGTEPVEGSAGKPESVASPRDGRHQTRSASHDDLRQGRRARTIVDYGEVPAEAVIHLEPVPYEITAGASSRGRWSPQ